MVRLISILLFFSTSLQAQFFYSKEYTPDYTDVKIYCRNNSVTQPSWSDARRIDNMIENMKEAGDWQELDGFLWLPSGSEAFAKINFIDTSFVATTTGTDGTNYEWTEGEGLKAISGQDYNWDLQYLPSEDTVNYGVHDAMLYGYFDGDATVVLNESLAISAVGSGSKAASIWWYNKGSVGEAANINGGYVLANIEAYPTTSYSLMAKRTSYDDSALYKDAVLEYSITTGASTGLPTYTFKLLGGGAWVDYIRCVAWGSSSVDKDDFDDEVKDCFTDLDF